VSPNPTVLLTIPQVAERLGCHRDHVYTLIAAGAVEVVDIAAPGARRPKTRVSETALAAYIRRQTRKATKTAA